MDASIIAAPSSAKNRAKERDPEMHQTKKGKEWHFGMKVQSVWTRRREWWHDHDICERYLTELPRLLHGGESHGEMLGIRELTRGRGTGAWTWSGRWR